MAKPNSRATLISYCKRALGHPVIEINVDEDQVDDRIDEAFQFYNEYHSDAVEKIFLKHKVTGSKLTLTAAVATNFSVGETITGATSGAQAVITTTSGSIIGYSSLTDSEKVFANEVITGGTSSASATIASISKGDIENGYIAIPDLVTNVVKVFPLSDTSASVGLFDIKYQLHMNDIYSLGFMGNLMSYAISKQWLAMADLLVDADEKHIDFNRHRNQLRVDMDWSSEMIADESYLVLEAFRILDPTTYTDIYNDYYLKRYATALIKKQWGINLSKFEGMVMPGGVTFNGRQILEDANEEIIKLEEEARLNWETPIDFLIG
ncbi:hypothetical protein CBD41_08100 [bacterium TMED181]|nr:MAG: hypothetical protein CBD41_08100 [bacterium TMED181]